MNSDHYPRHESINETASMLDYFSEALDDDRLDQLFDNRSINFRFNTTTRRPLHFTLGSNRSFDIGGSFRTGDNTTDFEVVLAANGTPHDTPLLSLTYNPESGDYIGLSERRGNFKAVQLSAHDMTDLSLRALPNYNQIAPSPNDALPVEGLTKFWSELAEVNGGEHISHATAIQSFPRGENETIEARLSLTEEETATSSLRTLTVEHSLIHTPLDAETVYRMELFYESNGQEGRHTQNVTAHRHTISDCRPELITIRLSAKNLQTGVTTELDTTDDSIISDFQKTIEAMISNVSHKKESGTLPPLYG